MSQGIFGIIDFNRPIERPEELAVTMGKFLHENGSVKARVSLAWDRNYVLGMKRIALADYQQPDIAQNEELQTLCLVHGEFHNYQDLVQEHLPENIRCEGDLDLALHLYRRLGSEFPKKLNGLFSIAVLDKYDESFIVLNDRFGMAHQIYWTVSGGRFYFATHLRILLATPDIRREIDPEGLNLFLKYSYIPSPWTIFKGIRKLPPGHFLTFRNAQANHRAYWEFQTSNSSITDIRQAVNLYREVLTESISRRIGANGEAGILLSGGLDSSANVALATQCTDKKLKTFSIGFEDPRFDERPYAQVVAKHFNTDHFEYTISGHEIEHLPKLIWHLEEPYFEFGLFLTYLGMAAARKEVDIVLGGEGADQLFGTGGFVKGLPVALRYLLMKCHLLGLTRGITRLLTGKKFYEYDNLSFKTRLLLNRVVNLNDWYFYGYDEHELSALHMNRELACVPKIFLKESATTSFSFEHLYLETQINQDLKHYVNENVMVKSGRMADMLDLSLRESYLDTEVADFLVSLIYPFKRCGSVFDHLRGNIKTKFLHRKAMETLLPSQVMEKPKQGGFVPVMIFLKDPHLRERIYDYLLNSDAMREYFSPDHLKSIFSNYEQMQGKKMYWPNFHNSKANRILFLLTFNIWYHFYLKNPPLALEPHPLSEYLSSGS